MTHKKTYIVINIIALIFTLINQNAKAQQNIAQQAYAVFEQSCMTCHGQEGSFKEALLIEHSLLIDGGTVVPGNPDASVLYQRLIETNEVLRMPQGLPPLSPEAIETIRQWIVVGAPDWKTIPRRGTEFITNTVILETIQNHINSLSMRDKEFARYFTLTHLYNAGETTETLQAYRLALSKLVNSLSWGREVVNPKPIDTAGNLFYIDLRDYEWDVRNDAWTQIEQAYPYQMSYDAQTQTALHEKLLTLQQETSSHVPFIHVDWFLATASLPPLYHNILALPETVDELEDQLEVYVEENLQNAPGKRVWRAGFNNSGVSQHNRVVERHLSRYGAYWKSYDFAGSAESQNIFMHPLDFIHDGGEIIFNLPNGLQAYYLVDAVGNRLDVAPTNIVSNPAASDPAVRNGLSCIGCHTEGMKTFEDQVRAVVEIAENPFYDKVQALDLYVQKMVMDQLVTEDTARFLAALKKIGEFDEIEPVQRFHEVFQKPLNATHAAASVGLETVVFLDKISKSPALQNLLGSLVIENGTVKRDAWTSNFDEVISILNTPDSFPPPIVERPPGASVHIPDPNLRSAIAEALDKENATDPITLEEVATLTQLRISNKDIHDITGIEHAINLEELWISGNPLSDISLLAKLPNFIGLHAWETSITDLSSLAGLTKLRWLDFGRTPVSDLSPLTEITSLRKLTFYACDIKDISPLADLTGLTHLAVGGNRKISDASHIAGLVNLEFLDFHHDSISDLQPLAGLTKLKFLNLDDNRLISDLSPLIGLTGLIELRLNRNIISNISPLARLINLKELTLNENLISDISALTGLINLEILSLRENMIIDISHLERFSDHIYITLIGNPGIPKGGPKIEGPWLWMLIPGNQLDRSTDLLAEASNGLVTEHQIATKGAMVGKSVGNIQWTTHKIPSTGKQNLLQVLQDLGQSDYSNYDEIHNNVLYGSVVLDSPQEQKTKMFVGTDGHHKIWLNGELIHNDLGFPRSYYRDYDLFFPITLRQGTNMLLVAIDGGHWFNGFFGFEEGTEYTIIPPDRVSRPTFSATETSLLAGDTFTLNLNAENITDLAGWESDIAFEPKVLEAVEVTEGDFLKTDDATIFFQGGTIDNATGKIIGINIARISEGGVNGSGTLLSVKFIAKAGGDTYITLENFKFGTSDGMSIPVVPPNITITVGEYPPWDVNQDGEVDILDLILVAQDLGSGTPANLRTDVNRDGTINIQDLILVAQHMGKSTDSAAPIFTTDNKELIPEMVQAWIEQAKTENDGSIAFQQGIKNLQKLLESLIPEKTALLANYPNPFNPETWIPYHLSKPADITITIYTTNGTVARTLTLGHQAAGMYQSRSRSVHWDGKNENGEPVSSGIYFYTLTTGDFTATRKMLILK